jgi:selenocysteine-specific elongation factor
LPAEQAQVAIAELLTSGQLVQLEAGELSPAAELLVWDRTRWLESSARAAREVENYHRTFPLRRGMPREELKSRFKIPSARVFNAQMRYWVAEGVLEESGSLVWKSGYAVEFSPQQQKQVERLMDRFAQSPFTPPSIKESQTEVGEDVFGALVDMGWLFPVSGEVVFRKQDYEAMIELVRRHFEREEMLTAAQFRDQLNTSRRYVLAFLEHLDATGLTVRDGDARKLRKSK